jgi:hypothetical protein
LIENFNRDKNPMSFSSFNLQFNDSNSLPEENSFDSWLLKLEEYFDANPGKMKNFHSNINSVFCKIHEVNRLLDKGF